jgi:hypothetical protein
MMTWIAPYNRHSTIFWLLSWLTSIVHQAQRRDVLEALFEFFFVRFVLFNAEKGRSVFREQGVVFGKKGRYGGVSGVAAEEARDSFIYGLHAKTAKPPWHALPPDT